MVFNYDDFSKWLKINKIGVSSPSAIKQAKEMYLDEMRVLARRTFGSQLRGGGAGGAGAEMPFKPGRIGTKRRK